MHKVATILIPLLLPATLLATEKSPAPLVPAAELTYHEVRYDGKLTDAEARFTVDIEAESTGRGDAAAPLFEGDVAVFAPRLPNALRIVREGSQYRLIASKAGRYKFKLDVVAKITRAEPWNQISFMGPTVSIASVNAQAMGTGMELQLLAGTLLESGQKGTDAHVRGFLGVDRVVSLRWQSKATEFTRKALATSETVATVQITPTVIKFNTELRYDIVQGNLPQLSVEIPSAQALTRVDGVQIRDWQVKPEGDHQVLTVEFIKPVEKSYRLVLQSEQSVEATPLTVQLTTPKPLDVTRESGGITVSGEDTLVEIESATGLRQVNTTGGALASYQFYGRPFMLSVKLQRIQPVLNVSNRVTVRLEEARLLTTHAVTLNVEKAGVYAVELAPLRDFFVADVRGDGIDDWKVVEGRLQISFSSRVLGARSLQVQLEKPLKTFPEQITMEPLRVTGAAKETAQIGAVTASGLRAKTAELVGLREIPITSLAARSDELLAYNADQPEWKLVLATERLAPRVLANVFNLVTIGDGLVGGSATIRYAIINQGVQEFRVALPAQCKNVEFTGPNIRRKEQQGDTWIIGLQDKAWGAYTLVATYDFQFDPHNATLPVGGIRVLDVERETGSIAITSGASQQLHEKTAKEPLRRIDESELADNDRALITRPVLLAYRYEGQPYELAVDVARFEESPVLQAVADRTQLTTVVTDTGQMLTQASFMVKNNAGQFQSFTLPPGADFWGCYVGGQAVKAERDGDKVLVPLPRGANRDQAVSVEIVYAQKMGTLKTLLPRSLALVAPRTDVPTTYAEWEVFVPETHRLTSFGGNMTVAQGTTYGWRDAWRGFVRFYEYVYQSTRGVLLAFIVIVGITWFVVTALRQGWRGALAVVTVMVLVLLIAAMLLPALNQGRETARRANELSNLKQIGLGLSMFADTHEGRLPDSLDGLLGGIVTSDRIFYDPSSGQRLVYVGAGRKWQGGEADSVLAYSPTDHAGSGRNALFGDGHVAFLDVAGFNDALQRTLTLTANQPQSTASGVASLDTFSTEKPGMGAVRLGANQFRALRLQQTLAPQGTPGSPVTVAGTQPSSAEAVDGLNGSGAIGGGAAMPAVAGIRPIRIEIPKTGLRLVFTKVLNVRGEPLSVSAWAMTAAMRNTIRGALQLFALLVGLALVGWQWRSASPKSLVVTVGLALAMASVTDVLITWRLLHVALILGAPAVVIVILVWLVRRYWGALGARSTAENGSSGPTLSTGGAPPVIASIALLLFAAGARADDVSILSATYTGTVYERVAQVDAVIQVNASAANQHVKLFGDDVAVQQFSASPGEVKLVRDGNTVVAVVPRRGPATLRVKFLVKLGGDVAKRQLAFGIPSALSSRFTMTIDEPEAAVEAPTAVSFQTTADKQQTRVEAVMGAGDRVELHWTPRVKRVEEIAATVFCQNAVLISFGHGVFNACATLDYQVTQGELRQVRVRVPADQRVLRVRGELIRTWEVKADAGGQTVVVELLKGVSPNYRLTIETEKVIDSLPSSVRVETVQALDVKRETGLVALVGSEDLGLTVETSQDVQRMDVEEFARVAGIRSPALVSAYRFLRPEFDLRVRVEALQPQIEAAVRNHLFVGTEELGLTAQIHYTIKRAGVFALRVALPTDYRVERVTGENILQWTEKGSGATRVLELTLKERTMGAYELQVELARLLKQLPPKLDVAGVQPLDVQKLAGFVTVSSEVGVQVKTEVFDGLTEVPAATAVGFVPRQGEAAPGILAFKFIPTETVGPQPAWKLAVVTESVEPWMRAEIVNWITVGETLVSGRTLVQYDVQNAPVRELRLRVPAGFKNVEVLGANIRRRDQDGENWRVELQNKVRGTYTLTVTWERPWDPKHGDFDFAGVEAVGVERETGALAVVARPPLQVAEKTASGDLIRIDARELPEWAGRADDVTVLAYRYLRPGYKLALAGRRFDEAEVLQALVDNVRLATVVAEDGQMMTEATFAVRNNGRQYLEVTLPQGAEVWSAFVAGSPVRPSVRAGRLLLPLEHATADGAAIPVQVTYVSSQKFPARRGRIALESPAVDVPLKNAQWELYLPPDYDYGGFAGTMMHEIGGALVQQAFTLMDYSQVETARRVEAVAQSLSFLSSARQKLAGGNVKEANEFYGRLQSGGEFDSKDSSELKRLKTDLRRAQAGNVLANDQQVRMFGDVLAQSTAQPTARDDEDTAGQQWDKLQQAQEVAVAKVLPLRVNLPTHGVRQVFTQVLQTEVKAPMKVSFNAVNTRSTSWPIRIGLSMASFAALWLLVAATPARRHS